jgi:hypothetical protein
MNCPSDPGACAGPAYCSECEYRRKKQELAAFLAEQGGDCQRTAHWYENVIPTTLGGSELAKIEGRSRYGDFTSVLQEKVEAQLGLAKPSSEAIPACMFGIIFEDVAARVVEIDLGGEIVGGEICIQRYPGYRNSPDGYIVARYRRRCADEGGFPLYSTDAPAGCKGRPVTLLLEFKCPPRRKPRRAVPDHYRVQVESGLALSPVAERGLFVDTVFRKCSLAELGSNTEYDALYHDADHGRLKDPPFAWGLIAVYTDRPGGECVDLGALPGDEFDAAMARITASERDSTTLQIATPCFADGRGAAVSVDGLPKSITVGGRARGLTAVLPWKLFELWYTLVEPNPGFLEHYLPLIRRFHETVARVKAMPAPEMEGALGRLRLDGTLD